MNNLKIDSIWLTAGTDDRVEVHIEVQGVYYTIIKELMPGPISHCFNTKQLDVQGLPLSYFGNTNKD